jgi:ferric-dicitrate binding protein FerR (iron transport regulator)
MKETTTHNGVNYKLTRLPSALDASKAANRIRPWMSRSEEPQRALERIARVRRESGIPSPDEWMW